jgi:hypothetical protein
MKGGQLLVAAFAIYRLLTWVALSVPGPLQTEIFLAFIVSYTFHLTMARFVIRHFPTSNVSLFVLQLFYLLLFIVLLTVVFSARPRTDDLRSGRHDRALERVRAVDMSPQTAGTPRRPRGTWSKHTRQAWSVASMSVFCRDSERNQ